MIEFSASIDKSALDSINAEIDKFLLQKSSFIGFSIINQIGEFPKVKKFREFLSSNQFSGDFGIEADQQDSIVSKFNEVFNKLSTISNNLIVVKIPNGIFFSIIDQDYLREITEIVWEPVLFSTSVKPPLLVNAWDIYEYGIIGGKKSNGRIKGYKEIEAKSIIQKKLSRSKLKLMVKSKNDNFTFAYGEAPRINSIRSSIASNISKTEKIIGKLLERFGKF